MTLLRHTTGYCLYLLLFTSHMNAGATEQKVPELPRWQVLQLEQKAFWATARSRIEVQPSAETNEIWRLSATSSVVGNSEEVTVDFLSANGSAVKRSRLSRGKDQQRLKSFDYQPHRIVRERRAPDKKTTTPPEEWPITSRKKIPYPAPAVPPVVTDPYTLLLLADRLQASADDASEVVVHTEFNFYRVRMTCGNGIPVSVDFQLNGTEQVTGTRETRAVAVHVTPLGEPVDKPDFSLLGLTGEIILFYDKTSGLLVQVRGTAPRIGEAQISLKAATLRELPE